MYSLIVDTATKNLYIALVFNDKIITEYLNRESKEHSKNIMPQIKCILDEANIKPKDLGSIYVGIGPGSYTGVRIGVAVCKMLAYTLDISLYQFSSLYAMASNLECACPYIDARRGNAFCGIYEKGKLVLDEALRDLDEFMSLAKYQLVSEDDFNPSWRNIMANSTLVNPHACVPNYLRETEAERNLGEEKK